jgi:hypothetical protein
MSCWKPSRLICLFYAVNRLIAVGADDFFSARIDSQIQGFKRDSAEKNFIGGWQYKGDANCPAVFPYLPTSNAFLSVISVCTTDIGLSSNGIIPSKRQAVKLW